MAVGKAVHFLDSQRLTIDIGLAVRNEKVNLLAGVVAHAVVLIASQLGGDDIAAHGHGESGVVAYGQTAGAIAVGAGVGRGQIGRRGATVQIAAAEAAAQCGRVRIEYKAVDAIRR